ncbi:helix-turn-helix transcriptional regulator [Maricaulis maris]|uniref:helix-turn-helix transcriptional regulator n=1 Tax=Maricaulis maris TaxID=74318 RepID=UPI003B8DBFE6
MGLKSLRLEKGWSQEQLATISGLSDRTIQRAERGETPSLETVRALAASFDLSSAQLRDLIQSHEETADMAANDTTSLETADTTAPSAEPLITHEWKRVLLAAAVYVVIMTWLALMQTFAGWDPELLPFIALVGGGLIATAAFMALGGAEDEKKSGSDKDGRDPAD